MEESRVIRNEDGTYRWSCEVDKKYSQKQYRMVLVALGILFVITIGYASFSGYSEYDLSNVLLGALIIMFIVQIIYLLIEKVPGKIQQYYILTDKYIRIADKGTTTIEFKNIDKVVAYGDALELYGRFSSPMVFVPYEDYELVSNVILQNLPEKAKVERR